MNTRRLAHKQHNNSRRYSHTLFIGQLRRIISERTLRKKAEAENAELAQRVQQLEALLAYARHCGA